MEVTQSEQAILKIVCNRLYSFVGSKSKSMQLVYYVNV